MEITRDRDALAIKLGAISYARVGRVSKLDAGPFRYRRIGRMWIISWRWK